MPIYIYSACALLNAFSAAKSTPSTFYACPLKHDSRNTTCIYYSTTARIPIYRYSFANFSSCIYTLAAAKKHISKLLYIYLPTSCLTKLTSS